jgi:hypothetical protein
MKGQESAAPSGRALEELNPAFFMKIAPEGPKPPLWSLADFQVVLGNLTGEVARPTLWARASSPATESPSTTRCLESKRQWVGRPFRARRLASLHPGLKPLGYSVRPLRGHRQMSKLQGAGVLLARALVFGHL